MKSFEGKKILAAELQLQSEASCQNMVQSLQRVEVFLGGFVILFLLMLLCFL